MISVKGYGIGNDIKFIQGKVINDLDKAVEDAIAVGFGLCPDKDTVVDSFNKAVAEQEKESGKKVEGIYPIEVEIRFTPKVIVKKVEYAEDKTDDN